MTTAGKGAGFARVSTTGSGKCVQIADVWFDAIGITEKEAVDRINTAIESRIQGERVKALEEAADIVMLCNLAGYYDDGQREMFVKAIHALTAERKRVLEMVAKDVHDAITGMKDRRINEGKRPFFTEDETIFEVQKRILSRLEGEGNV